MSKVAITGNASGTGTFTLAAPNSNTDRTLTLPDAVGTVVVTGGAQTIEFAAGTAGAPSITTTGDTNTGIYFPAADTIGFVCGGTEDFRVDGNGQLWNTINSQVGTDYTTLYKGHLCRAWVNFNGTGTVAIRASGNVSSITDNGTGDYTVNFTTAMPDANYAINLTAGASGTFLTLNPNETNANTTSAFRIRVRDSVSPNSNFDIAMLHCSIFR